MILLLALITVQKRQSSTRVWYEILPLMISLSSSQLSQKSSSSHPNCRLPHKLKQPKPHLKLQQGIVSFNPEVVSSGLNTYPASAWKGESARFVTEESVSERGGESMPPPLPRVALHNVSCMRNAQVVLRDINVSVHDGGALVLTGSNGAGKSTFLRMLAGFSRPSAGRILWDGHDVTSAGVAAQWRLQLNWLSLKDAIKEDLTVLDNVQWFEVLEKKDGLRSLPALEFMGLGRLVHEKARILSMGQRKRLQLARMLAIDRPIWLMDEPSVALDYDGVKLLEAMIADHRKKGGIVFVATHLPIEMEDAMNLRLPPRFPRRKILVDLVR
ncbi:ABC transporter I family member 1 isoform X1 [Nymphaea colorata]|nr:ABC transporter I family member 1 isoform X1 [Nymphaea colorata]